MASSETHNQLTHSRTKTNYVAAVVVHTCRHGSMLELWMKIDQPLYMLLFSGFVSIVSMIC